MTLIATGHVLVTGGASGIGRGLALRCAALGAGVTILDKDAGGAGEAAAEAAALGAAHTAAYACDVGDREQVTALADVVRAAHGPVDVLVNNAGVVSGDPLLDLSDERIETTFRVNALAPIWVTRAFLPAMLARGTGHVVVVASAAGLIGSPRLTDYSASKHAAVGFAEALRMELRRSAPALRVTVVCPSYIDTGMFEGVTTRFARLLPILKEDDVVAAVLTAIQRDKPSVLMPFMVRTLPAMRLLPTWAFDRVADLLGVTSQMDHFTGRAAAGRQAAPTAH
jgi:all-trans-retinol dehydrogenase (NAD+)